MCFSVGESNIFIWTPAFSTFSLPWLLIASVISRIRLWLLLCCAVKSRDGTTTQQSRGGGGTKCALRDVKGAVFTLNMSILLRSGGKLATTECWGGTETKVLISDTSTNTSINFGFINIWIDLTTPGFQSGNLKGAMTFLHCMLSNLVTAGCFLWVQVVPPHSKLQCAVVFIRQLYLVYLEYLVLLFFLRIILVQFSYNYCYCSIKDN